ncbi:uncharacterized protein LOC111403663 isoform X2 [Olea europaea var. sylvestris]|uniref:uncharacterized protein LOC111403663 isoform X2 n=1 Tax=Olea europaea var. sylvestris TaxID=158386 RepID=UPI000C1D8B86|nr:uncharacterized protein LOC111403663 isoform X2 [Olea europaea var. sylvestris]
MSKLAPPVYLLHSNLSYSAIFSIFGHTRLSHKKARSDRTKVKRPTSRHCGMDDGVPEVPPPPQQQHSMPMSFSYLQLLLVMRYHTAIHIYRIMMGPFEFKRTDKQSGRICFFINRCMGC